MVSRKPIHVLLPMGDDGAVFRENGYLLPRALIRLRGRPLVFHILDRLPSCRLTLVCHASYHKYDVAHLVGSEYGDRFEVRVVYLSRETRGVADSVASGLDASDAAPVLVMDTDAIFPEFDVERDWEARDDRVFVASDPVACADLPRFAYVKTDDDGAIARIVEKQRISDVACVGIYGFSSASSLLEHAQAALAASESPSVFLSDAISSMLRASKRFATTHLSHETIPVHDPLLLRIESLNVRTVAPVRVCFDIDRTLVVCSRDYTSWTPIERTVRFLRHMRAQGHTIVLHTARRMRTHAGNVGGVLADVGELTLRMLRELEIPYDEIHFGKPYAHFYVDDLAISAYDDLQKATGFYMNSIDPRSFHDLENDTLPLIRKRGADLSAQIAYYEQIPRECRDLFPLFIRSDPTGATWYDMERIKGLPLSNMYVSEIMTTDHLRSLLDALRRLHTHRLDDGGGDIYANYSCKVTARYNESLDVYAKLEGAAELLAGLCDGLNDYEDCERGTPGMIHGDCVLTNVLLTGENQLKLIDMRGALGTHSTTQGDVMYDRAKLYQSLVGYDEILLQRYVSDGYRANMLRVFESEFEDCLADIFLITSSLFFSLIPLHSAILQRRFMDQAAVLLERYKHASAAATPRTESEPSTRSKSAAST